MHFEFEGHKLHIEFAYLTEYVTECRILTIQLVVQTLGGPARIRTMVGVGRATRHFKDAPNRDIGRKLALARALEAASGSKLWGAFGLYDYPRVKEFKRAAWTAYLNRKPKHNPILAKRYSLDDIETAFDHVMDAYGITDNFPRIRSAFKAVLTDTVVTRKG